MYYIKKIFRMLLSIFSIGTFFFLLLELIPGDPETTILGIEASAKDLENLREQLGLNLSFGTRYWNWLCGVFQGDLGISFKYKEHVFNLILERLPLTISIAFISIFIVFIMSIPLSFFLHNTKNKRIKKIGESILSIFISIPSFWLGIIFMYLFGIILKWASTGYNNTWQSLILPCLVISIPKIGWISMHLYSNLYKELREDYIKYLYSNGMKKIYLNFYILKKTLFTNYPFNRNASIGTNYGSCYYRANFFYSWDWKTFSTICFDERYSFNTRFNFLYINFCSSLKFYNRYFIFFIRPKNPSR